MNTLAGPDRWKKKRNYDSQYIIIGTHTHDRYYCVYNNAYTHSSLPGTINNLSLWA